MFMIVSFVISIALSVHVGYFLSATIGLPSKGRLLFIIISALFLNVWWIAYGLRMFSKFSLTYLETVADVALTYLGVLFYFWAACVVFDLLRLTGLRFWDRSTEFYISIAFTVIVSVYGITAALFTSRVEVYTATVNKKNIDASLVLITDTHIGSSGMTPVKMEKAIIAANELRPDVIILGGDVIERTPDAFIQDGYAEIFKKSAAPIYAVMGNHEYYGQKSTENARAMTDAGMTVLRDDNILLPEKRLALIGRDDAVSPLFTQKPRKDIKELASGIDPSFVTVLIDHSPHEKPFKEAVDSGIDLQLSGHTHNGQLFPFNYIVEKIYPVAHGIKTEGPTTLIVSSGYGYWGPPIRTTGMSEIVYVKIKSKE